ncbi:MAG: chemotaxis protein CheR [Nocardioides sp.]|nr:chemotaxis protein CheR [Nocardioides sp.]
MRCEPGKEYLVEARLLPLAREAGYEDVDAYVARLRVDAAARADAVDALTINETSWFRDLAPYQTFTDTMLPALLESRAHVRHLELWSAACSSGQEAYSLAMLLRENLPPGWTATIHATDVSRAMLTRVKAGRYSQVEMNRGMPATRLVRWFERAGSEWQVSEELRSMITTEQLNLAAPFPPMRRFDVVFLRNVLIYFDAQTKSDILRRVHHTVAPDGFLLLGTSEYALDAGPGWQREVSGKTWMHRPEGARPATPAAGAAGPAGVRGGAGSAPARPLATTVPATATASFSSTLGTVARAGTGATLPTSLTPQGA